MDVPSPHSWADLDDNILNRILEATNCSTASQGPTISALRLVCKHWCQAAGYCNIQLDFCEVHSWEKWGVRRDGRLGTMLARSFSGVSTVCMSGEHIYAEAVDSLGQLPHLTKLSFVDYFGPGLTAAHFTKLQSLTLHSTYRMLAKWLPHSVPHLQGLTELVLNRTSSSITAADLGSLSALSSLKALWLENEDHAQKACSILPCLTLLTRLGITSSLFTDEYLTGLQAVTGLEVLNLRHDPYIHEDDMLTDGIMPTIAGLHRLQHLDPSGSAITDAAMPHIACLTNLRELGLECMENVGEAGIQQLRGLTQLTIRYSKIDIAETSEDGSYDDDDDDDDASCSSSSYDLQDLDSCENEPFWEYSSTSSSS